jgi:HAD superfamily hydrolase (TIGR01509 family)
VRERPRLDAVLLDAGGTLVRLDFEWMSDMLATLGHAVDTAALRRAEVEGRRRYDASGGRPLAPDDPHPALGSAGDINAYFGGMLEAAGVPPGLLGAAGAAMHARQAEPVGLWARPVEGAAVTLTALRERGLRLAVVSNSDGRAEAHLVHAGVRGGLEFVVDSQIAGFEKPDPRLFRIALERMEVAAEHALYVGDIRSVDEAGALAAGLHVVIIDPYGDYVPPDAPSIPSIGALPDFIDSRFEVPSNVARAAETARHERGTSP